MYLPWYLAISTEGVGFGEDSCMPQETFCGRGDAVRGEHTEFSRGSKVDGAVPGTAKAQGGWLAGLLTP